MGDSLLSGVSGLQAYQKMLDVAGDNLANLGTTGFKSSRVTFSEVLSETIKEAQQATSTTGGTNPMQVGSGVQVASIDRNMTQGSMQSTGQALDMAIEGSGFFTLYDGQRDVYTRVGAFAIDSEFYLVDPATGYRVERIGSEGVAEGFQDASSSSIRIPKDVAIPAKATSIIDFTNNLQGNVDDPTTSVLSSGIAYTVGSAVATADTPLADLDQGSTLVAGDQILISGVAPDGTEVAETAFSVFNGAASQTVGDLLAAIAAQFPDCNVAMDSGKIVLTDKTSGYSQTDITLKMSAGSAGELQLPSYFTIEQAGGQFSQQINTQIYDSQGNSHQLSGTFVRTDTPNTWDMVINKVDGVTSLTQRRVSGITFLADGTYGGTGDTAPTLQMTFDNDPTNVRTVALNFGSIGSTKGLTQYGQAASASASGQDGYAAGWLSSMSINREGVLVGIFTNGIRRNIAALKIATFQNPAGLSSLGNNYFATSSNSGDPVMTKALSGGAGSIQGGALEKSNVEVATEFVNLIQAQNGYQANARTIKVANDMLQQLTTLIR